MKAEQAERILYGANLPGALVLNGGNSTVTRVVFDSTWYAVKDYSFRKDGLKRLQREWWALDFLSQSLPGLAPNPLWSKEISLSAIHSWVPGSRPELSSPLVKSMVHILKALHDLYLELGNESNLLSAEDSIHEGDGLESQILSRLGYLEKSTNPHLKLIVDGVKTNLESLQLRQRPLDLSQPVTLSPSDFGPHNLLFDGENKKVHLVDLEFFGVDACSKLVADTLLHPQTEWSHQLITQFVSGSLSVFPIDIENVWEVMPLLCLKWATIIAGRLTLESSASEFKPLKVYDDAMFYVRLSSAPDLSTILSSIANRH